MILSYCNALVSSKKKDMRILPLGHPYCNKEKQENDYLELNPASFLDLHHIYKKND